MAGNLGHMACFSFHEQKNMSTLGEGGMITTNDPQLYERARGYKSHCARVVGESTKYLSFAKDRADKYLENLQYWYQDFDDCGYNFRMNDVTASVGICQLDKLELMNKRRNDIAELLNTGFSKMVGIKPCSVLNNVYHTYHLYPILINPKIIKMNRDQLVYKLRMDYGIKCGLHYMPLTQTSAFMNLGYSEKDSPIACEIWRNLITLPIHPRLTNDAVTYLINSIQSIVKKD
jgi:dTDP-4-amino-4,6-dideoxygalactose transaminase